MNTLDIMKEDLALLEKAVTDAKALVTTAKKLLAQESCPYDLGHEFHGKGGKRCKIVDIEYRSWGQGFEIMIRKYKKNGDLYEVACCWDSDWDMSGVAK